MNGLIRELFDERVDGPGVRRGAHHRTSTNSRRRWTGGPPRPSRRSAGSTRPPSGEAAELFGTSDRVVSTVLQGFYQSHQATAAACQVNNLHLLRGMIGRPGCGVLQMNGQPTAQNTRECGADGDLPGFRNWDNPRAHRGTGEAVERGPADHPALGAADPRHADLPLRRAGLDRVPVDLRHQPGGINAGAGADPPHAGLGFVVPGRAGPVPHRDRRGWPTWCCPPPAGARRPACFTNVDRTVHLSQQAVSRPVRRAATWTSSSTTPGGWSFTRSGRCAAAAVARPGGGVRAWQECSRGRPCDYTGLSYERLSGDSGIQWPCTDEQPEGTARLYGDGIFPTDPDYCEDYGHDLLTGASVEPADYRARGAAGRAILKAAQYHPAAEEPDERVSAGVHHRSHGLPFPYPHQNRPNPGFERCRPRAMGRDVLHRREFS